MLGRLGAGEAEEFGKEKGERGSREEGKRAPGYFQKFQTLVVFFYNDIFMHFWSLKGEGEVGAVEATGSCCCSRGD